MSTVKQAAIQRAEAFLRAAGCQYRIMDSEGREIANTIQVRRRKTYTTYRDHYVKYLSKFEEGTMDGFEVSIQVPEEYKPIKYLNALQAYCGAHYGKGSYVTTLNKKDRIIDLILIRQPKV